VSGADSSSPVGSSAFDAGRPPHAVHVGRVHLGDDVRRSADAERTGHLTAVVAAAIGRFDECVDQLFFTRHAHGSVVGTVARLRGRGPRAWKTPVRRGRSHAAGVWGDGVTLPVPARLAGGGEETARVVCHEGVGAVRHGDGRGARSHTPVIGRGAGAWLRAVARRRAASAGARMSCRSPCRRTSSKSRATWGETALTRTRHAGGERPLTLRRRTTAGAKRKERASRFDVFTGMTLSNLVMFAIITATASTLGRRGGQDITSAAQAAGALRPVAGSLASTLFALGFIGSGMLAVPVLAGAGSVGLAGLLGTIRRIQPPDRQPHGGRPPGEFELIVS
jgi:Natural resistance-associated macrophage protein